MTPAGSRPGSRSPCRRGRRAGPPKTRWPRRPGRRTIDRCARARAARVRPLAEVPSGVPRPPLRSNRANDQEREATRATVIGQTDTGRMLHDTARLPAVGMTADSDDERMRLALDQARRSLDWGDVPVGAVV